jgi:hypothetical protein
MVRQLALLSLVALAVAGCNGSPPERTPAPTTPEPPLSVIGARLTIPQTAITIAINSWTREEIANLRDEPVRCGIGNCKLTLKATRTGNVSLSGGGDSLLVHVPFAAQAEISAPGFLSVLRAKGDGRGEARTRTALGVGPDWKLKTATTGDVVLQSGTLRLGPFSTDIAKMWNNNEEKLSRPLWRAMDRELGKVDLKPQVTPAWRQLFTPIALGKSGWLVLTPETLRVARPVAGDGAIVISLQLEMRGRVVPGSATPRNPRKPLPAPGKLDKPSDRFAVSVPVLLPYGDAAELASAVLARHPSHVAGMSLRFADVKILPSGSDVVLETRFCTDPDLPMLGWLKTCGTGYLRGVPRFDAKSGVIRITDIRYETTSGDFGLRALNFFARGLLSTALEQSLVFEEKRQIERLNRQVTAALAKPVGSGLSIAADIESFGDPVFTWTKDGFLASFSARGRTRTALSL